MMNDSVPHVFLTSNLPWDPSTLDDEFVPEEDLPVTDEVQSHHDAQNVCINDTGDILPEPARITHQVHFADDIAYHCKCDDDYIPS